MGGHEDKSGNEKTAATNLFKKVNIYTKNTEKGRYTLEEQVIAVEVPSSLLRTTTTRLSLAKLLGIRFRVPFGPQSSATIPISSLSAGTNVFQFNNVLFIFLVFRCVSLAKGDYPHHANF